jgi:hypothetical protein
MKPTGIVVLMLGVCSVSLTGAEEREKQSKWNLVQDVMMSGNQISFSQGSNAVWYFMEGPFSFHAPATYSFMPEYLVFCDFDPATAVGIACWKDPEADVGGNRLPFVAANFGNTTLFPLTVTVPPRSVFLHPGIGKLAIVAWKSPINGKVTITGSFGDIDATCGDGILWAIDKGSRTLQAGDLPNGGTASFAVMNTVKAGQVLYFIVHPKAEISCDSTNLQLIITRADQH